jgi:glycosyltransferase involved in cell wall biosynthesis
MRVALIDPSLHTLPYDAALAAGLRVAGHEVTLHGRPLGREDSAAGEAPLVPSFYRLAETRAVRALPAPVRIGIKGADHVVSMAALTRRLKRERPDIVHFQWLQLPVADCYFLQSLRALAPLVLTVHDSNPFNGNPTAKLQVRDLHRGFAMFDRLIVHTEQGRRRLQEQGIAPDRIRILPHGLLKGPGAEPGAEPAMAAPDSMQSVMTFLMFGKIQPYKGVDVLIQAFARLSGAQREQARLRVVGKPYMDMRPLRALARELGVDPFLSLETRFVAEDDIPGLFAPGTVAAFPYREIEASGVLSLAIGFGRPILASRLGGFAETVTDGTHGLLVPPEDDAALAAAMVRLIEDRALAARCAQNVAALAGAVPSWDEIARQTQAVYAEAAAQHVARSRAATKQGAVRSAVPL